MANRRLISGELFDDEFFGGLTMRQRVLWVGLLTACADDQGRFLANASLVRAKVFPFDDVSLDQVQADLLVFIGAKRIYWYEVNGKELAQVLNWWKYQAPAWASPSRFPAPDGWVDRVKAHTAGNKVVIQNWDQAGGFVGSALSNSVDSGLSSGLCSDVDSGLSRPIKLNEDEDEDEYEGEVEEAGEAAIFAPAAPAAAQAPMPVGFVTGSAIFVKLLAQGTGMFAPPPSWNGHRADIEAAVLAIYDREGEEQTVGRIREVIQAWKGRGYNPTNPAWVDWLVGGIPEARAGPKGGRGGGVRDDLRQAADDRRRERKGYDD